jgi:Uma2 family endonuclease
MSPVLTIDDRVTIPSTAFDHPGYRTWVTSPAYPDGVRTTYVEGEVLVEMSPESGETHNKVKTALTVTIGAFVREHDLGEVYSDGMLLTHAEAGLSTEPDLCFVSWAGFADGRVRLQPREGSQSDYIELLGAPDLVVEIVSDSSVRKDTRLLPDIYGRAGVREYWLIDARGDEIRFQIFSNSGTGFVASADPLLPQESGVLEGRWQLTRSRNRAGRFAYALDRV